MTSQSSIYPLSKRADIKNEWLQYRLENILPSLMKQNDVDMWIILGREYNEDPVLYSLFPAPHLTASRLTGFIFSLNDAGEIERLSLYPSSSTMFRSFYQPQWDSEHETQAECLARIIKEKKPKSIGINTSKSTALADGLTKTLYDDLIAPLDAEIQVKIVSAEKLAVQWLEQRTPQELAVYPAINRIIHEIIGEAFSDRLIKPGVTTTTDVEWWMMEKVNSLGLKFWFPFDVDSQRQGEMDNRMTDVVIQPGDLLRCDVGIEYLGLMTDTQRVAYILKPGETDAPAGIRAAMKTGNKFQDIVCQNFIEGRSGNDIFVSSIQQAKDEGIDARLYTHPIGVHGHGAGPTIGVWGQQDLLPERGNYPLHADTCYALELSIAQDVPEWDDQHVFICLEQTVAFTNNRVEFLDGRQTELLLVK